MRITTTKGKKIVEAKVYKNILSKTKGLMFSPKLKRNCALLFENKIKSKLLLTIHTYFVFQDIDAVWLDEKKKIVDIQRNIKPFSNQIRPDKAAKYLIEMPANTSKNLKIKQELKWK